MASFSPAIQIKTFQDWLKGALAVLFAKQGLEDFASDELTQYQKELLESILRNKCIPAGTTCNTCTTENVLPCPTTGFCTKGKCKVHDPNKPDKSPDQPCPKNICQNIRDAICREHRHGKPFWKNSNATKWCFESYEIAKCYMSQTDDAANSSLKDTDINGILAVIMNNNRFQKKMATELNLPENTCTKALDVWNKIRHSAEFSISDTELAQYINTLTDLLSDPKYLAADQKAQEAVDKLKQLKSNTLTITTNDLITVLDTAMEDIGIKEKVKTTITKVVPTAKANEDEAKASTLHQLLLNVKSSVTGIQTVTDSSLDQIISTELYILDTLQKDSDTVLTDLDLGKIAGTIGLNWDLLGPQLGLSKTTIDHIQMDYPTSQRRIVQMLYIWCQEEGPNGTKGNLIRAMRNQPSVNIDWEALEQWFADSKNVIHQPGEQTPSSSSSCERQMELDETDSAAGQTEVDLCKSLREDLISFYRKHHSTIPISPLVEEHDFPLTEFYVQPQLTSIDIQKRFGQLEQYQRRTPIHSYHDLFCQGDGEFSKDIYVVAKAGVGKTSFAKRICMTWCQAHSPIESLKENFRSEDIVEMRKFDLLLLLPLRDTDPSLCDLDSMVFNGILCALARRSRYSIEVLEDMLQERTSLVILDGLDEWSHPETCSRGFRDANILPHIPARERCTVMTTTRPWKMDAVKLSMRQIDKHVEINELDDPLSKQLIDNAVTILNKQTFPYQSKTTEEFQTATSSVKLDTVRYIPYILLQMICLWFDGKTIGNSRCQIYSNIIELTLSRGLRKLQKNGLSYGSRPNLAKESEVPYCFHSNEVSKLHYDVLLGLGKVAFETLFSSKMKSCLVFDRMAVLDSLSEENLTFCLRMGLLSQNKDHGTLSERSSKLSFQHKSIQEYFAALYIQSCPDSKDTQERILRVCETLSTILEMSNVFIFLAGLSHETCDKLLQMLHSAVSNDEATQIYRSSLSQYELQLEDRKSDEVMKSFLLMQTDIVQEMKESGSKEVHFRTEDIIIDRNIDQQRQMLLTPLIENNNGNVKSLCIRSCGPKDELGNVLKTFGLQNVQSLQKLEIRGVPGQDDLHHLLSESAQTLTCLGLSSCIYENDQYRPAIQQISPGTITTIINMNRLQSINFWNIRLEHSSVEDFFQFLGEREAMTEITLSEMTCTDYDNQCTSHNIDLSKHFKLRLLHLANIPVSDIHVNSSALETCVFGPLPRSVLPALVRCLQDATHLQILYINNAKLIDEIPEILPKLVHLEMLGVLGIDLGNNTLTLPPEMKSIVTVIFYKVIMNNDALKRLVESVNVLPQPVTIGLTQCDVKLSNEGQQRIDYDIRSSSEYKVLTDDSTWFKFQTCKRL
ncbi:uncharacterized protein LOC123536123 [Mercenaria mercenaria]|uniref:uncharacterized protein LOC123536123 n=1 Tax=Mercenaria mercenaria TaxID=6596 RepID=UPI00234FAB02|nr:uncharacterized protein LOC123536123 [Mercenaria mercenaria]